MFFMRLRRQAKWVFVFLAAVFALSFVFLGVGAGGSGIGDYLGDLFRGGSNTDGTQSVDEARAKVAENPDDPAARRDLANALQAAGQTSAAIPHLQAYTEARPKDADALTQLAALLGARAQRLQEQIAAVQASASGLAFSQDLTDPSSPLAQTFAGPLTQIEQQDVAARTNELVVAARTTYVEQADAWEKLTKLQPNEPSHFLQLGQAEFFSGSTTEAIAAWKQFLKLAPDDPNAPLVRRQIRALEQSAAPSGGG